MRPTFLLILLVNYCYLCILELTNFKVHKNVERMAKTSERRRIGQTEN